MKFIFLTKPIHISVEKICLFPLSCVVLFTCLVRYITWYFELVRFVWICLLLQGFKPLKSMSQSFLKYWAWRISSGPTVVKNTSPENQEWGERGAKQAREAEPILCKCVTELVTTAVMSDGSLSIERLSSRSNMLFPGGQNCRPASVSHWSNVYLMEDEFPVKVNHIRMGAKRAPKDDAPHWQHWSPTGGGERSTVLSGAASDHSQMTHSCGPTAKCPRGRWDWKDVMWHLAVSDLVYMHHRTVIIKPISIFETLTVLQEYFIHHSY